MAFGCGAAQARCFEPHLQNKKEIPDIRHLSVACVLQNLFFEPIFESVSDDKFFFHSATA